MSTNSSPTGLTTIVILSNARTKNATGTSMPPHSPAPMFGKFESQFKFIPATAYTTLDIATSMKSLFRTKSSPNFVQTLLLLPRPFRIISKSSTASPLAITRRTGPKSVPSKSSTVPTKRHTILSQNTAKRFNIQTQEVQCNSTLTQRQINSNDFSFALLLAQSALHFAALCLVLMGLI